jgi:hypothetical protein
MSGSIRVSKRARVCSSFIMADDYSTLDAYRHSMTFIPNSQSFPGRC